MERDDTTKRPGLLIVDSEVLVRHALADYLRECGYRVLEADGQRAALEVMAGGEGLPPVELVLSDVELADGSGFALRAWARQHRPDLDVMLAGILEAAAKAAGELCDEGPHLSRPYEHQLVADRIKRMLAARRKG